MNYKVLSHDYTNNGGNCMVSTFQVWLEDENKTVFLHMNEEGGTLATCDYINHEIEFVEDMMLDNFYAESIGDDNKYLELYFARQVATLRLPTPQPLCHSNLG